MNKATAQVIGMVIFASVAFSSHAATLFFDDFEDGDHAGWVVTSVGNPLGYTGVETHNDSLMAVVQDTGDSLWSLSRDFSYTPNESLSFTMQAIANSYTMTGGGVLNAASGVTVSFLNVLNSTLGSITIANATDPGFVDPNSSLVDTAQHEYSVGIGDLAALAGLDGTDPISNINLSFFASAQTYGNVSGVAHSSSTVWFDNVTIGDPVPIPAAAWLFGSGLLGMVGIARRKKAA